MVLYKLRVPNIGVPPNHPLFIGSSHIFPGFPAWALLPPSVPPGQRGRGLGGLGKAAFMLYWSHNFTSISKTCISEEFTLCLNPDFWCFLKQQSCFGEAFRKPKQKWKYPWYQQDSSEETTQVRLKLQEWTSHQTTSGHLVSKRQLSHISLRCRKTANCFHVLGCFKDVEGSPARSSINLFVFQFVTSYFGRHWFASTKSGHISWHPGRGMTFQAHETVLFQKSKSISLL